MDAQRRRAEVRPPSVLAVVMPAQIVRTPKQRRRNILEQDVARYGPTTGCETCLALAGGAQRVAMPLSDECMDELMQRDEDALLQRRLHADRLRRSSMSAGASGDEQRDPDVEGSGGEALPVGGAEESTRIATEAAGSGGDARRAGGAEEPMRRRCRHETRIEKISRITN